MVSVKIYLDTVALLSMHIDKKYCKAKVFSVYIHSSTETRLQGELKLNYHNQLFSKSARKTDFSELDATALIQNKQDKKIRSKQQKNRAI